MCVLLEQILPHFDQLIVTMSRQVDMEVVRYNRWLARLIWEFRMSPPAIDDDVTIEDLLDFHNFFRTHDPNYWLRDGFER